MKDGSSIAGLEYLDRITVVHGNVIFTARFRGTERWGNRDYISYSLGNKDVVSQEVVRVEAEGIRWARGWDSPAAKALKAARAL